MRATMAFSEAADPLQKLVKVPAHQKAFAGESPTTKFMRLGNDWADSKAKGAVSTHPPMEEAVFHKLKVAMGDARAACRVLAATTLLWPAAAPMIGHA